MKRYCVIGLTEKQFCEYFKQKHAVHLRNIKPLCAMDKNGNEYMLAKSSMDLHGTNFDEIWDFDEFRFDARHRLAIPVLENYKFLEGGY